MLLTQVITSFSKLVQVWKPYYSVNGSTGVPLAVVIPCNAFDLSRSGHVICVVLGCLAVAVLGMVNVLCTVLGGAAVGDVTARHDDTDDVHAVPDDGLWSNKATVHCRKLTALWTAVDRQYGAKNTS